MNNIQITVSEDQTSSLNDLTRATLDHYPIGFGVSNESYDGAKMVKAGALHGFDGTYVGYEFPLYAFLFDNEYTIMKNTYVAY